MNPYLSFVQDIAENILNTRPVAITGKKHIIERDEKILLFSPHPDDECITGLLPLRLQMELDIQVVNIPMTFGSNPERKNARAKELQDACHYLGWKNHMVRTDLENLKVTDVLSTLTTFQPQAILFPHHEDWNTRHIEVHHIVMKALQLMPASFSCLMIESEFWGAMNTPNLLVEGCPTLVSELVAATSLHIGEVSRNPYHLNLPAWMQDNVRRGAELVGGQGSLAPQFTFGTLYRVNYWKNKSISPALKHGQHIPLDGNHLKQIWK